MMGQRQLIVVVDDDVATNEFVCELLADEGYQTIGVQTGAEAFELIQQAQPALVITDLAMERADAGYTLLQKLRLIPACAGIPAIMAAANHIFLRENGEQLRALDCDALAKPFDIEALL